MCVCLSLSDEIALGNRFALFVVDFAPLFLLYVFQIDYLLTAFYSYFSDFVFLCCRLIFLCSLYSSLLCVVHAVCSFLLIYHLYSYEKAHILFLLLL